MLIVIFTILIILVFRYGIRIVSGKPVRIFSNRQAVLICNHHTPSAHKIPVIGQHERLDFILGKEEIIPHPHELQNDY